VTAGACRGGGLGTLTYNTTDRSIYFDTLYTRVTYYILVTEWVVICSGVLPNMLCTYIVYSRVCPFVNPSKSIQTASVVARKLISDDAKPIRAWATSTPIHVKPSLFPSSINISNIDSLQI